MNKRRTISILFVLTVIVIAGSVYRLTFRLPVATTKVAGTSIDNGMRPRLVTSRDASDFDELIELITETIEPDQWAVVGSPTRILKANQLIEIEALETRAESKVMNRSRGSRAISQWACSIP